jgi:hypothetical protein
MSSRRLADGSGGGQRSYEPACVRALDAYLTMTQQAERLSNELDNVTPVGVIGAVTASIAPDDSLVIALQNFADSCNDSGTPPAKDDSGEKT